MIGGNANQLIGSIERCIYGLSSFFSSSLFLLASHSLERNILERARPSKAPFSKVGWSENVVYEVDETTLERSTTREQYGVLSGGRNAFLSCRRFRRTQCARE